MTWLTCLSLAWADPGGGGGGWNLECDPPSWALPNLVLDSGSIVTECLYGAQLTVEVTVYNDSPVPTSAWLDLFVDPPYLPLIGDYGDDYRWIEVPCWGWTTVVFPIEGLLYGNVDLHALVDTDRLRVESNESDNEAYELLNAQSCQPG